VAEQWYPADVVDLRCQRLAEAVRADVRHAQLAERLAPVLSAALAVRKVPLGSQHDREPDHGTTDRRADASHRGNRGTATGLHDVGDKTQSVPC
jgi:hypothetical protein